MNRAYSLDVSCLKLKPVLEIFRKLLNCRLNIISGLHLNVGSDGNIFALMVHYNAMCLFQRKFDDLSKECDLKKDEFGKFEQQDVRCREDIKHAHVKKKKLEKSLEQEEKKVNS